MALSAIRFLLSSSQGELWLAVLTNLWLNAQNSPLPSASCPQSVACVPTYFRLNVV